MLKFGEALKQQREACGLSQNQLAKATGISQQNISRWEKEEKTPSIIFCAKLADFYGITLDELVGRDAAAKTSIKNSFNTFHNTGDIKF